MKVIFYKPLWFLTIFIISLMPVFGQTDISTGSDVCLSAISRYQTGGFHPVHYMKTGPYSGNLIVSYNYPTVIALPVLHRNINDICVVGNTIFFCGEDTSGNGYYAVCEGVGLNPSIFNARYFKLYNLNEEYITSAQRIRVFCEGSDTNVLLIGNYLNKVQNFNKSAIIHIKNDTACTVSYGSVEHFDDVEILDDYVVTVARKGIGGPLHEPHYMRVLNKSSFSLYDTLFNYYYGWDRRESISRILLQKTVENGLVSVYHTDNYGYFFNTYTVNSAGILQLYNYTNVVPQDYPLKVCDVSYNTSSSTLSIAHNSDTMGYVSLFGCSLFPTVSNTNSYKLSFPNMNDRDTLTSITRKSPSGFYISGIKNNKMLLWMMPHRCEVSDTPHVSTRESQINRKLGSTVKTPLEIHRSSTMLLVTYPSFTRICTRDATSPKETDDEE